MDKIRYSEKNYLCNYDLSLDFFNDLGIEINDVYPLRKVFIISTDSGSKILKKVDYSEERVIFINECLNYVKKNYENIISYNELKNGLCYKKWKNDIYVVMDVIDGREISFSNPIEIELCAKNIALMHNASMGLRQYLQEKYNKDFLDVSLKEKYKNAYRELTEIKGIVENYKYKNEFDELFMKNIDKYLSEIKEVQDDLEKSEYDKLRNDNELIVLCHNDLAYHNFLIKNKDISIIDFDFLSIDLRIMDIANFTLKSIKNAAFDVDKMSIGIRAYEYINTLRKQEKDLLYIMMKFPKDFYTIVRDYYYKRKKWDYEVYLNRFQGKINNEDFRYEFLKEYKNIIN